MGRPKGAKNRPKDTLIDNPGESPARGVRDAERADEIVLLMSKYKRGADLLGLTMAQVDHMLGDPEDRMGRRLRFKSTGVPVPLSAVALYQRIIPLSEEYLRAPNADAMPDGDVLDAAAVAASTTGQGDAIKALLKTLGDHGITTEAAIARAIEFVVTLGYFKMDPQEVFDAVLERKNRQAVEAFERARKEAKGERPN